MIAKRLALAFAAILVSLVLLEVGTRALHRIRHGEPFPGDALRERLAPTDDPDRVLEARGPRDGQRGVRFGNKAIHPYLGYVLDREAGGRREVNRFGFYGPDPLARPAADEVRVALTGGSVAVQLCDERGADLVEALSPLEGYEGKRIHVLCLAAPGYKQPQQLLALTWLLSLGARFDVVINLDGFNEAVLPLSDNAPHGVHSSFPRSWDFYQTRIVGGAEIARAAEIRRLEHERSALRDRLGTGPLSRSAFLLSILSRLDASLGERIASSNAALRDSRRGSRQSFQATGPFVPFTSEAALHQEMAAVWQRSSLQMARLVRAGGGRYYHFLQPNLWLPDSKLLSPAEQDLRRVREPFAPKLAVPVTYPLLERAGEDLVEEGVAFRSLTGLFRDEERPVYRDSCCHFNRLGTGALARGIADFVAHQNHAEKDE